MKQVAIYVIVSAMLMVPVVLALTNAIVPCIAALVISASYMWFFRATKYGRKLWHTWYRVAIELNRLIESRISK